VTQVKIMHEIVFMPFVNK